MDVTISASKFDENYDLKGLGKDLAMWLWNVAVSLAPYDTGALRKAITLNSHSERHIKIVYNAFNAYYLHFLEQGKGPITKHKGFISELTVNTIFQELVNYFLTGKTPITSKPTTVLRKSEHGPMFYEKKVLNKLGYTNLKVLTAEDRIDLSNLRYNARKKNKLDSVSGLETYYRRMYKKRENSNIGLFAYLWEK